MPAYQTLEQISANLQTALLRSRTDFLLQQTQLWQEINKAGKESDAFVKPSNLDLAQTKFEFFITPKASNIFARLYYFLTKTAHYQGLFRLCGNNTKRSIKVMIEIGVQSNKPLKPKITTEPESKLKPEEMYVTGISV